MSLSFAETTHEYYFLMFQGNHYHLMNISGLQIQYRSMNFLSFCLLHRSVSVPCFNEFHEIQTNYEVIEKSMTCSNRLPERVDEVVVLWNVASDEKKDLAWWRAEGLSISLSERGRGWWKVLYVIRNKVCMLQSTQMWSFWIRPRVVSCVWILKV